MESMLKDVISFADESGISKASSCYTIGILNVPSGYLEEFNFHIENIYKLSGIQGEIKWEKVRKSSGQINLCLDILKFVLSSPCTFNAIAVSKAPYKKWHTDEEKAFFITYNQLLKQSSKGLNANFKVYIDQKSTKYPKQDEVMQIITNHMLAKLPTSSKIELVTMQNSKLHWGLQAVDILTGAVNTGYLLYFNPKFDMQMAKKLAVFRMAAILGWDQLAYDTRPNNMFNIWHFPIETRAIPDTKDIIPNFSVPNISRVEYEVITGTLKA
jgi:hypothetical protein